jgi:hypothetical protein
MPMASYISRRGRKSDLPHKTEQESSFLHKEIKVIQHCSYHSHPYSDQGITSLEFLASPDQSPCLSLELSGMILRSVHKVKGSPFGHLHDQLIDMVPDFGSPQK